MTRDDQLHSLLAEVSEYLRGHSDVIDGPEGQPLPNRAMSLLMEVEEALASGDDHYSSRHAHGSGWGMIPPNRPQDARKPSRIGAAPAQPKPYELGTMGCNGWDDIDDGG